MDEDPKETFYQAPVNEIDRKKFIFDDDTEESLEQVQSHLQKDQGNKNAQNSHFTLNKYDSNPALKKAIAENQDQMQTAHFNKHGPKGVGNSEQPSVQTNRDIQAVDQKAFNMETNATSEQHYVKSQQRILSQGTGQFGTKEASAYNDFKQVDQFNDNVQVSPKIKGSKENQKNDQISNLLAQL